MIKEKPEVGDVWKHKKYGKILYITVVTDNYIDFISFERYDKTIVYLTNTFSKLQNDDRFEKFAEVHEYLGKSKANIKDLFEVKDG